MAGKFEDKLKFLQADPAVGGYSDADRRTLAAFGLKPPR